MNTEKILIPNESWLDDIRYKIQLLFSNSEKKLLEKFYETNFQGSKKNDVMKVHNY